MKRWERSSTTGGTRCSNLCPPPIPKACDDRTGPPHRFAIEFEFLRQWDARALQTQTIAPQAAATVVLLWTEKDWVDGGPSPCLAGLLASALAALGEVAFRWRGEPPQGVRTLGETASPGRGRGKAWTILATRSAQAAARLFDEGWAAGDQTAAIATSEARAMELLASPDRRRAELRAGEVLFSAIVDGAGALLAAATPERLTMAISLITHALSTAGDRAGDRALST